MSAANVDLFVRELPSFTHVHTYTTRNHGYLKTSSRQNCTQTENRENFKSPIDKTAVGEGL
jgi:hypothetical protein